MTAPVTYNDTNMNQDNFFRTKRVHLLSGHTQEGVVLLISLIVLVAMTLAAIALVRSVDTTNIIAGNLAFQQAATNAGDLGSEQAIDWIQTQATGTSLYVDNFAAGYAATWNPQQGSDWNTLLGTGVQPQTIANTQLTAMGYSASYIIQRMCALEGVANSPLNANTGCAVPATPKAIGKAAGFIPPASARQIYYRITTQIAGPRNTFGYTQSIVAI
jgi:Tfp pilus assembly protein PilX